MWGWQYTDSPYDVERKLKEFSYENLNIIRNSQGIERAIRYFTELGHDIAPQVSASNLPELCKAVEKYPLKPFPS